ncbi:MAG: VOC family protein [Actinobacteria bacterium]|nr:VOC family protein [Actinomycetota bacterium]
MTAILNPYLSFDGNAREAFDFYAAALGGTPVYNTFGENGMADSPLADKIMHARLETPSGFTLMASDTPPGAAHQPGTNVAISLSGDDEAQLRDYWDALSADATINVPFEKQMWGDTFGYCTDQFGIGWMVNITG